VDAAIVCFVPIFLQFLKLSLVLKFSENFDLDLGLKKGFASDYLVALTDVLREKEAFRPTHFSYYQVFLCIFY